MLRDVAVPSKSLAIFQSPSLPWEVVERVIDHSANSAKTLKSFTLACSDLRPRSTMLLLCHAKVNDRNHLFGLCAFLQTKPHLLPCIRSVLIPVHEFSPHPLLRMLPNLSEIKFTYTFINPWSDDQHFLTFHPSVLKCCRPSGKHIQTLSLHRIYFPSLSAFSDILLLFPRIESLSCKHLHVNKDYVHDQLVTHRLSKRLHLRTLTVSTYSSYYHLPVLCILIIQCC